MRRRHAAQEYGDAVKDGKIADVGDFQVGWGVFRATGKVLAGVDKQLAKDAPAIQAKVNEHMRALKRSSPMAPPP